MLPHDDRPGLLLAGDRAAAPRTLLDVLRASTEAHPDASALDDGEGALSYREVLARVIATAARLKAAGVGRGHRVGVRMPSGTRELYVAILAVLAAGAAYVPVDADDPQERADLVFGEADVAFVIDPTTARGLFADVPPHPSTSATPIVDAPEPSDDAWITWADRFRHATATTDDFRALVAEVAGEPMGGLLDAWLFQTALPRLP